jgi:dipeptidyl-peptidase-4
MARPYLCGQLAFLLVGTIRIACGADPAAESASPTYTPQSIEGWQVRINDRLLADGADAELGSRALALLQVKLFEVLHVLPDEVAPKLQSVPIWVEVDNDRQGPGACYHPSGDWLRDNGFDDRKAKAVEICRADNFVNWSHDQPSMLLHELAHAFHDQQLGFEEARIKAAYESAREAGIYDDVLRISGVHCRAYAMENHKEYFAELTEAYFGTNDFYPFVRAELKEHDPAAYELLSEIWSRKLEQKDTEDTKN